MPAGHIGNALTADTNFPDDLQLVVIAPAPAPLDAQDLLPHQYALADVNNDVGNDGNYTTAKSAKGGLNRPVTLCRSAAEHTARLASTLDLAAWKQSREEFWMLYCGPLAIVEDVESQSQKRVEPAMVEFGNQLKTFSPISPTLPLSVLEQPALNVAYACRDLLSAKWNVGVLG
ncbi:MAG TPA: hypothetical protein VGO70_03525, partial [Arsenicitalea sp.]|nr:hypothetical protein [Arsenicitalea sp.]